MRHLCRSSGPQRRDFETRDLSAQRQSPPCVDQRYSMQLMENMTVPSKSRLRGIRTTRGTRSQPRPDRAKHRHSTDRTELACDKTIERIDDEWGIGIFASDSAFAGRQEEARRAAGPVSSSLMRHRRWPDAVTCRLAATFDRVERQRRPPGSERR
jgi:hypothetical protein